MCCLSALFLERGFFASELSKLTEAEDISSWFFGTESNYRCILSQGGPGWKVKYANSDKFNRVDIVHFIIVIFFFTFFWIFKINISKQGKWAIIVSANNFSVEISSDRFFKTTWDCIFQVWKRLCQKCVNSRQKRSLSLRRWHTWCCWHFEWCVSYMRWSN